MNEKVTMDILNAPVVLVLLDQLVTEEELQDKVRLDWLVTYENERTYARVVATHIPISI